MATEDMPSDDEFTLVDGSDDSSDYETEWIDVEAGESVAGEIRAIKPNCGQYDTTVIELARGLGDLVAMWSNGQIDTALEANEIGEGDVVKIEHTEETRSFTTEDGDEREYDVWNVYVKEGDDGDA